MDRASVFGTDAANSQVVEYPKAYNEGPSCACQNLCQNDARFATLAGAWTGLPDALKAGIVAMVNATGVDRPGRDK